MWRECRLLSCSGPTPYPAVQGSPLQTEQCHLHSWMLISRPLSGTKINHRCKRHRFANAHVNDTGDKLTGGVKYTALQRIIPKIQNKYSQFPHSCVCERFIYSHDWSAYFSAGNMWTDPGKTVYKSLTDTWMWKLGLRQAIHRNGIHQWFFRCSAVINALNCEFLRGFFLQKKWNNINTTISGACRESDSWKT